MIEAKEFLDAIFVEADPDTEQVCVCKGSNKPEGGMIFWNVADDHEVFERWAPTKMLQAWYFCVSTVGFEMNEKGTALRRRAKDVVRYHCLVLDDIGTKATPPPVTPSWKITTSETIDEDGNVVPNEQWGFILVPGDDMKRYEALVQYCHEQGWGDAGAGGCYRVMRVPGSTNIKHDRDNFKSVVTHWAPDAYWKLDDLAALLNCDDLGLRSLAQKGSGDKKTSATIVHLGSVDGIDPLSDWLNDNGYVVSDDGGDFVDIKCPWHEQHTSGSDTAGYSPLGRGEGEWVQRRGFKCLHEHCVGKGFRQLMDVLRDTDAPQVSGVDPLPWLQHKFTYIGRGSSVADLEQRTRGGDEWMWEIEEWGRMYKGRVRVPGRDGPIEMKTAFLEHPATTKVRGVKYLPVRPEEDTALVELDGQKFVNTYIPPTWGHTSVDPDVFLDHVDFLLPSPVEADLFLDWLAHKIQNPAKRSYAVVMIAEDGFGVGRSWLAAMMARVLQGKVETATLAQLIGKGTSAENNYNDWSVCNQLLVVEEAKDNISKEDFYNGYETFKQNVDTRVRPVRVNPKYGRTRSDFMFFNALIFSNHSDALAVPANDRRLCVLTNPSVMAGAEYYERLEASLSDAEARKIYWFLMERDLSNFDHVYPIPTPGKRLMTDQNVMPSEAIREHIKETCDGDIFTKKMLKSRVIMAANVLDYDNIASSPGTIIRSLWGKMGKLRDDTNGARYSIGGDQTEVRAIRNLEKWKINDKDRRKDLFEEEVLKNDRTGGSGLKIV